MNLKSIHNIYFIGIGGVGMSALAKYFVSVGKIVGGYDKKPSLATDSLIDLGISIQFEANSSNIHESFTDPLKTLVVFTPAVSQTNQLLNYFKSNSFQVLKRSEVLGIVTKNTLCLAVAGTHGKTTTTSILAHLLYQNNEKITAFVGGVSENYQSNFIQRGTEISVVEADEFDRSFLTLSPDFACITSIDADHLDVYGSAEDMQVTFKEFAKKIKSSALQEYLEIVVHRLAKDIQVQYILKDLDKRTQQIRDAAIPDTQKLSLVQRYRTADERQFSKTLGELLELQKRRQSV